MFKMNPRDPKIGYEFTCVIDTAKIKKLGKLSYLFQYLKLYEVENHLNRDFNKFHKHNFKGKCSKWELQDNHFEIALGFYRLSKPREILHDWKRMKKFLDSWFFTSYDPSECSGGLHINLDPPKFHGNSVERMEKTNLFLKNLFTLSSEHPELGWFFNDWMDNDSGASSLSHNIDIALHESEENNLEVPKKYMKLLRREIHNNSNSHYHYYRRSRYDSAYKVNLNNMREIFPDFDKKPGSLVKKISMYDYMYHVNPRINLEKTHATRFEEKRLEFRIFRSPSSGEQMLDFTRVASAMWRRAYDLTIEGKLLEKCSLKRAEISKWSKRKSISRASKFLKEISVDPRVLESSMSNLNLKYSLNRRTHLR